MLLLGFCAAMAGCGEDAAEATEGTTPAQQNTERFRAMANRQLAKQRQETPVAAAAVTRGPIADYYQGSANLTAAEEAVVVARTRGVVEALFVEEGDVVRAGDRLAQLETERLELELERSRTQLESLEAAYQRAKQLHERRMISPNEYDAARFNYRAEQANLRLREYELREAAIRATLDGVITRRHIKVGQTLSQNSAAFEMKRLRNIEAILNVPEREMGRIHAEQSARVLVDALPEGKFQGTVSRVAPEVDPSSGTFRVTVSLANEDARLKPGMFARVGVRVDERESALLVPLEAVMVLRNDSSVFLVDEGIATRRSVKTGYVADGLIELVEGVDEGDQVVSTGQDGLRSGEPVRVVGDFELAPGTPATSDS